MRGLALVLALVVSLPACGARDETGSAPPTRGGSSSPTCSPSKGSGADESPSGSAASFKNGVLTTKDVKVQITRCKVIPVGQKGNESGEKPVIAFWYKTTNLSGAMVDSTLAWILNVDAYQGNDPNAGDKLAVAAPPDDRLRFNQAKSIDKGGTVENAFAYELDDLVTPVDVVATQDLDTVIGKTTYDLR